MMKNLGKTLFAILLVVLAVEIVLLAPDRMGSSEDADVKQMDNGMDEPAQQVMSEIHLVEAHDGEKEWELWAGTAYGFSDSSRWLLQEVKVRFFGQNGETYLVEGRKGSVETLTRNIEIAGDVSILASNGYLVKTDRVVYNSGRRDLSGPGPVVMLGPRSRGEGQLEVFGQDLSVDLNSGEMIIAKDVKARKRLRNGRMVSLTSQSGRFSSRNKIAAFLGDAVVDYGGSRITGPTVELGYDQIAKTISSMLVKGGARITDINRWATASQIQMLFDKDKYVLRGSPRVVQKSGELRGEEIVFLNEGREIQVKGAKAHIERPEDLSSE